MITSKQIKVLSEKYLTMKNVSSQPIKFFVNPTSSELMEASNECNLKTGFRKLRCFVNNSRKEVYVADAYFVTHADMGHTIGFTPSYLESFEWLNGVASVNQGKARLQSSDDLNAVFNDFYNVHSSDYKKAREYLIKFFNIDWSWADKYIQCSDFIKYWKQAFETELHKK